MDKLIENIDITNLSNYKTAAKTRWYFEISQLKDLEELKKIIDYSKEKQLPILWISSGTNMLFAFDVFQGIVIKNSLFGWSYNESSQLLHAYGAESIWDIAQELESQYDQDLWHRFIGLPGSIAGAIYGNAGCFGLEVENNFISCELLDLQSGETVNYDKEKMGFGYRSSRIKKEKKYFIISALFDLSKKVEKYHSEVDNVYFREYKQPKGNSCGSFFKNPNKEQSAGSLIEKVGLKGKNINGACFSQLHANFLMNIGGASYKDMLSLISLAQDKVYKEFGIQLVNEVQIITNK